MHLQVVPESGFSEPVDVKLRIKVPDPALGIFTIYDGVQDLGTHTYPYDPMEYSLALDPDNPPEGYEFIRKAYNAAKKMNIRCVDVNILVRASGGGFVCEEKLNYKVNL